MNPAKAGKIIVPFLKDGVYFTFDDVKKNKPNLLHENLFKSYYDTIFTISHWSNTMNLYYKNEEGKRISLSRDSIWGYCENGIPYICIGGYFHKVNTLGSISVFTEFYPVLRDPMPIVVTDVKGSAVDRLLDFENGRIGDYDLDNFNFILMRDEPLFKEFNSIKKLKSKKKKMYSYLEKYNERHPLFETPTNLNEN
ncbi:MAG: hypothetical protein ACHQNT_03665 [Bacteroidia bacterium]